eukprot:Ihof_evm3s290 gene=Ihof_evmTU3s290
MPQFAIEQRLIAGWEQDQFAYCAWRELKKQYVEKDIVQQVHYLQDFFIIPLMQNENGNEYIARVVAISKRLVEIAMELDYSIVL